MEFGYEGLGLFYTLLEKLAQQEKPVKTQVLKSQLKVGKRLEKCWDFMEEIELIHSSNGDTFNKQLLNFSEKYQIKKEKNSKRISEWRKNQEDTENVTRYESVRNTPKVKESKVNRSKVKESSDIEYEIQYPFTTERFLNHWKIWKDYKKKEHKFNYKSEISEQAALNELSKISLGIEQTAIEIINQSMSNGYKGLFALKTNENGTTRNNRQQSGGVTDAYREKLARDLQTAINQNSTS